MRTIGESAKFLYEGLIPRCLDHLDEAMLTLCYERISTIFFRALFAFSRDVVALQQSDQVMGLELPSSAGILRDTDSA